MNWRATGSFIVGILPGFIAFAQGAQDASEGGREGEPTAQAKSDFPRLLQMDSPEGFIRRESTERQRKIAEKHALAYLSHLGARRKAQMKEAVRFIAVDTEETLATIPKAKKVIMVWDMDTEALLGKLVFEFVESPVTGSFIEFLTFKAKYVGPAK